MEKEKLIKALHKKAIEEGKSTYTDPETGFQVRTSVELSKRKFCCGYGCRHCPFLEKDKK